LSLAAGAGAIAELWLTEAARKKFTRLQKWFSEISEPLADLTGESDYGAWVMKNFQYLAYALIIHCFLINRALRHKIK